MRLTETFDRRWIARLLREIFDNLPAMSEETLSAIVRGARDPADQKGWTAFWNFYEPLLRRYVRRLKVKPQDADDVVQNLYFKLRELMPRFEYNRDKGPFRGWLRRVTDSSVHDHFRSLGRQRQRDQTFADYYEAVQKTLDDAGDTDRERLWVENVSAMVMDRVRKQLAGRETLACFEETILKQRPAKDVAAELGIQTVNNVYVYASRVMKLVKSLTREYDGYEPDEGSDQFDDSEAP